MSILMGNSNKNARLIREIESAGSVVAHSYSTKMSNAVSHTALVWNGNEWWLTTNIPSHDRVKDHPRYENRGQPNKLTWRKLSSFDAALYIIKASEVERGDCSVEDSRLYRMELAASIDDRIEIIDAVNWEGKKVKEIDWEALR